MTYKYEHLHLFIFLSYQKLHILQYTTLIPSEILHFQMCISHLVIVRPAAHAGAFHQLNVHHKKLGLILKCWNPDHKNVGSCQHF